ncbi:MAG: transketolase [Betaproteobacteria bacterium]|jgi:transketolase|nr:transketolase [Betaproteobacteria bacterium]MBK7079889.1 transketolase [Betaproteobacteria bacterium]MBK7592894.1 transketolase [Betaproteobacteria bacterium]MBK8688519.1 transketolase [Betaproteobacteria bacterium]
MPTSTPAANALRFLAIDAVEKAKSGHPGMPMGMADIATVLWQRHLRHNPADPHWVDRDRFVLSNGHGSMLLYALLHLSGYDLSQDELKNFRQLHSKTPGHPEVGLTPGVETTTGPLGQGLANAVGMALAERMLAQRFNKPGLSIVDHRTYAFVGDGCLMEGVSHEVCSLAGVLGLGKLVVLYDDNGISIDGEVRGWFRDDTAARFRAYGWNVVAGVDGHDPAAIDAALRTARSQSTRPTLILCRTHIGFGSPGKADTADVHGAPLGADEVARTRERLQWTAAAFEIPAAVRAQWDARAEGAQQQATWASLFAAYAAAHPADAAEFQRRTAQGLPADWAATRAALLAAAAAVASPVATRKASQQSLEILTAGIPEMVGGSADLTGSNLTDTKSTAAFVPESAAGNYLHYGVREFGMAALMNGMALHGGLLPYGGTFLVFSDYARNAIRMSALMHQRVVYVFTHDSIGLGEDGPTHQPVEHAAALRIIPGLDVWRPGDAYETAVAWAAAVERGDGPSALLLSRQNIAQAPRVDAGDVARGGYVLAEADGGAPRAVIIATGSEVPLALQAQQRLQESGLAVRVVSMPCTAAFERQSADYRARVLPATLPAVAVEAGHPETWWRYVGREGRVVGIARFGESAPAPALYAHFGITADAVVAAVREVVGGG